MSVYDDMREVMEDARMKDECDYFVYSQMFDLIGDVETENAKLRELVYDMLEDEERGHNDDRTFREHVIRAHKHGIAKDIEV